MSNEFVTVAEAASFTGVTVRTIYYHITKSKKLFPVHDGGVVKILKEELYDLYPARTAGRKQFLRNTPQTREGLILEISNLISANAIAGEMHTVERLAHTLRYI